MEDNGNRRIVNVVTEAKALSEPTFLIKVGDKYFATLALWEYDPDAPGLSHDQRRGVAEIERLYQQQHGRGEVHEAVPLPPGTTPNAGSTNPPRGGQA